MPHLIVLVGPSGAGKTTLESQFVTRRGFGKCVSTTTRDIRPGEVDGVDYHFTTKGDFERLVEEGEFVESACFGGKYYGLTKKSLNEAARSGNGVAVLVAEIEGWKSIVRNMGYTYNWLSDECNPGKAYKDWTTKGIFLFIRPRVAADRLVTRGDLSGDKLQSRIQGIPEELKNVDHFLGSVHGRVLHEPSLKQIETFVDCYDPSAAVKPEAKLDQVPYVLK